jgi:hypothetical protein
MPDITRILQECPKLNVTVALGIDGLKEEHEKIRGKAGSWEKAISTASCNSISPVSTSKPAHAL